ncbi:MAG: DNA-binding protein [Actinobacteria bacterium]|nr:MAG: DNA-binding protein [Actinomycetota bacterium]RIK06315.1 MAG: DNA-binding protein [Acidobacteriota bacterium]
MRIADLPDFLTVEETAAVLRIGRTSAYAEIRRWERTGGAAGIPSVRFGRSVRVPKAVILRLLDPTRRRPVDGNAHDAA